MLTRARPTPVPLADGGRELASRLGRAALAAIWAANSPGISERFIAPEHRTQLSRTWFRTADGWELPLWRRAPRPDADGAPVLLAVGPALLPQCLTLGGEGALVSQLHRAGMDVYLLSHRGDPEARPPAQSRQFDFDDLVAHDLHAAIQAIRSRTRAERLMFIGHGIGGLLFVAHMARGGREDLATGVTICAPVSFEATGTRARELQRVARMLPAGWHIPHRALQRFLLATGRDRALRTLAHQVDGPTLRRVALDNTVDLSAGLVRQIARWHSAGHLCDRDDRFDDIAALTGTPFPLLAVTGDADPVCSLEASAPLVRALDGAESHHLSGGWGHLDPLVGTAAAAHVCPRVIDWLRDGRQRC
ncbi:MAG: alpha/beta hydrolase, partial [Myxococcota bacterium]|nr:alpha/beta hydrolase [Myxococcota bacterium]